MVEIISVRFKEGGKHYYFNPNGAQFQPGEGVIVETTRGTEFGECVQGNTPIDEMELTAPLRPVLRRATPEDELTREKNKEKEAKALESEDYQDQMAWTIHMGVMEYLNTDEKKAK